MKHRVQDNASELMIITINSNIKGGWKQRTDKLENELNIQAQDYTKSKQTFKIDIENKISKMFYDSTDEKGKDESKIQHLKQGQPNWKPGTMKKYLIKLSKKEASPGKPARYSRPGLE